MPNVYVLSPRDLVSRPDNMDETVPLTQSIKFNGCCKTNVHITLIKSRYKQRY